MPMIAPGQAPRRDGTTYPAPYDAPCQARSRRQLGDAAGLTQFGVNLLHLPSGAWSSQRHHHSAEDEFVWVLEGEVILVTDAGEQVLRAGDCAGFAAGDGDGHHIQNRSGGAATLLEIGSRREAEDSVIYPDIDLIVAPGERRYRHKDGTPYSD